MGKVVSLKLGIVRLGEVAGGCDGVPAFGGATGSEQNLTEDQLGIGAIRRLLDGGLCESERFRDTALL